MKVLIVVNHAREDAMESARRLEDWLDERGVDVAWAHDKRRFPLAVDSADDCDLVVSLGGDGTLLRAARIVGYAGVPVLGISYGHLGFLTAAGPEDLMVTVRDALAGELHVSRRATLDVECEFERPDGTTYTRHSFALNDFALSRGGAGDMVEFDVSVSGKHIDRLRGDGFVVSTATGSTGYALAAGGPIVTPEFRGMVCVPIAPHTIMARAFLTSPSDVVEIEMSPERPAMRHFFADGQPVRREKDSVGVRACVRRGPGDLVLLDRSSQSFYDSVSRVFYGQVGK
ncbi:NAD(+)/NADH kinase [Olsenella sp. An188]|uniref:NAD(+)/NADH kinase n=1 Tax=Olsenella sp. An188 TaxID=1965579 RepID=UPI000B395E9D|nr:NAD(+)/NADH kinase [Olsenella sp. An188]OUP37731.1 ATP-NAD kinase [Olsenella sp. An188]